jgi:hypothetical protein
MDIPYKGYTITPNSERQPDGRWLPVAELEVSHRGVVTPKPPLRAAPREIRATRADADAAAVKMAKAWVDASERAGASTGAGAPTTSGKNASITVAPPPKAPVASDVDSPRMPQETRAQDARADKLDWAGLYQAVGLDSDEKVDRLTRLLVVQFLLDRLVTLALAAKLASSSESRTARDLENILDDIAPLPIPTRADLASRLGVVASGVAESIVEINRVRNGLVHFKPTRGKPGGDVGDADEIASQHACDKCLRKGIEAVRDLMSAARTPHRSSQAPGRQGTARPPDSRV